MRRRGVKFGLRSLMILVAVSAVILIIFKGSAPRPEPRYPTIAPRYRYIEVIHRNAKGSVSMIEGIASTSILRSTTSTGRQMGRPDFAISSPA